MLVAVNKFIKNILPVKYVLKAFDIIAYITISYRWSREKLLFACSKYLSTSKIVLCTGPSKIGSHNYVFLLDAKYDNIEVLKQLRMFLTILPADINIISDYLIFVTGQDTGDNKLKLSYLLDGKIHQAEINFDTRNTKNICIDDDNILSIL